MNWQGDTDQVEITLLDLEQQGFWPLVSICGPCLAARVTRRSPRDHRCSCQQLDALSEKTESIFDFRGVGHLPRDPSETAQTRRLGFET